MSGTLKPPFTEETARAKIQAAEDLWNTRAAERVVLAYTEDTVWRNRAEFLQGRAAILEFLKRKWTCLLYTSPSPRDQRGSRMPSSA